MKTRAINDSETSGGKASDSFLDLFLSSSVNTRLLFPLLSVYWQHFVHSIVLSQVFSFSLCLFFLLAGKVQVKSSDIQVGDLIIVDKVSDLQKCGH